jgi:hypothetical protein
MPPVPHPDFTDLPGEAIIRQGLTDLAAGRESIGALLVQIGSPRLRLLVTALPAMANSGEADRRLYELLSATHGREAHSQFNSLIRQLVSFERALERRVWARRRELAGDAPQ